MSLEQNMNTTNKRWFYLAIGVLAMLFTGSIYAWSILKMPLSAEFGWTTSQLTLNFTLTMCFFCLGGVAGGILRKKFGVTYALLIAGVLVFAGFASASRITGSIGMLYLTYGIICGLGIGISYNVLVSTVGEWFPDRKGFCSGCMMMGFGASSLIVGSLADSMIENPHIGWRKTYFLLGLALLVIIVVTALILKRPETSCEKKGEKEASLTIEQEKSNYTLKEMLATKSFWMAFLCISFLAAVGNTVISVAKDLSLFAGAEDSLATALVGVLAVCNGLGRILCGGLFDKFGRRKTMLLSNAVTIAAATLVLISLKMLSVPLCIAALCVTGLSYGTCPTISATFVAEFYGQKNYGINYSAFNFNLMAASFIATGASIVITNLGYDRAFMVLLGLTFVALILNIGIKRP